MFRQVANRVIQGGREAVRVILQRGEAGVKNGPRSKEIGRAEPNREHHDKRPVLFRALQPRLENNTFSLGRFYHQQVSNTLAAELRRQAALQFRNGAFFRRLPRNKNQLPIYAFVCMGLATGNLMHSEEEDGEGVDEVCNHVRKIFKDNIMDISGQRTAQTTTLAKEFTQYDLGPYIAKGANAAVYQAKAKDISEDSEITQLPLEEEEMTTDDKEETFEWVTDDDSDIMVISESEADEEHTPSDNQSETPQCPEEDFDLAIKIVFNYDVESNPRAILRAMENEAVPAVKTGTEDAEDNWEMGSHVRKKKRLKSHPNIVDMRQVFVDSFPDLLPEASLQFPAALPQRLNPDGGFGKNKTMFLVMKRYPWTLKEYLASRTLSHMESLMLFTQLVEAVVHMTEAGIAHRDLKSNNILIEETSSGPHLVVSDFGCCLADPDLDLKVPYNSDDVNIAGNAYLMAPEVACAQPGRNSFLDYRKYDLWAAGALAYEIFGFANPFDNGKLNSASYKEQQLPDMPGIPVCIRTLVKWMLSRDPSKRPSAEDVSNILHFLLWSPKEWLHDFHGNGPLPSNKDVMRWILLQSADAMLSSVFRKQDNSADIILQLKVLFLARISAENLLQSVEKFLHYM